MRASPANIGGHYLIVEKSHDYTNSTGWVLQGDSDGKLFFGVGNGSAGAGGLDSVISTA